MIEKLVLIDDKMNRDLTIGGNIEKKNFGSVTKFIDDIKSYFM